MEKLDLLPNEQSPCSCSSARPPRGPTRSFSSTRRLTTAGEGKCKPSADECAVLYLGPGSEQEFTSEEGDSYTLRIDQIRKVKVGDPANAEAKKSAGRPDSSRGGARPRGLRRFLSPLLADLVSVSSGADANAVSSAADDNSTSEDDRR